MAKTPEEAKLWRAAQKLDSTNAMAEYKEAEALPVNTWQSFGPSA
jgi:hypothetical protein